MESGADMMRLLVRFVWRLRFFLLRAKALLSHRDLRAEVIHLGMAAARRGEFGDYSAAVLAAGGLSAGWDPATLAFAATAHYDAGQTAEAVRLLEAALKDGPDDPTVLSHYGRYLFKEGRTEESLRHLKCAQTGRPYDPWIMAMLGGCHFRLGDLAEARHWFMKSLNHQPRKDDIGPAYSYLGHIAARMEEWPEAVSAWREAARRMPGDQDTWYNLGNALYYVGDYRRAIRTLNENLRLGNQKPVWTYYVLARCYQGLGDIPRAKAFCEQALRPEPNNERAIALKSELEALLGGKGPGISGDMRLNSGLT
jgi:tetratricopeptide (TPR) repeat protein